MRLVALSVGGPREVEWRGELVRTSIFKQPVTGPRRVDRLNIEGDQQSDLSVHGGLDKAVYVYPAEHYPFWRGELAAPDLSWGSFGENLTTEGLVEADVRIGDQYRIGTAEFVVTQPRMPCFKLGIRFGRPDMVKRFQQSGRSGFYLAVLREGVLQAGDLVERTQRDALELSVADIVRLFTVDAENQALLRRATEHPTLAAGWRDYFRKRLWEPDNQ
jgi:MOSC domain-containing protein YiiM